jgi:hypothetical protein
MGFDETIWLTDKLDNTVRQYTYEGKLLRTIGQSGKSAPQFSGRPFNQCTHVAIDPDRGVLYISDGYINAAVHKYSYEGDYIKSWGTPGTGRGQFCLPHNVVVDHDGLVYVADRHNSRVQLFTPDGELVDVWYGMGMPSGLHLTPGAVQLAYVLELSPVVFWAAAAYGAELGSPALSWVQQPGTGHRITVRALDGRILAQLCDNGSGPAPGKLQSPHGLAVDNEGNIAVAELPLYAAHKDSTSDKPLRSIIRLQRISGGVSALSANSPRSAIFLAARAPL